MLSRDTIELVVTAMVYIVLGMFLGNLILIALGMAPIIFLSLAILVGQPRVDSVVRTGKDVKINVDERISDSLMVRVSGGPGVVTVCDSLPGSFALEEGSNFRALWKGLKPLEAGFSYTAKCAKRGYFDIREVVYESWHPLQVSSNILGMTSARRTIVVQPQPLFVRKIKNHKGVSRIPMPMDARFRFGIPTTDFKEIRDYRPGDYYRDINWKASAKHLSLNKNRYMVNDYEREGRKVVWVFLDSATHMALGTAVSNTLEYAVRAALGFASFYLERDCMVGLCIYNHDATQWEGPFVSQEEALELDLPGLHQMEEALEAPPAPKEAPRQRQQTRVLYPDVGKRQQYRITKELIQVEINYSTESLKEVVHTCRRHILGTQPLFVVITMLEAANIEGVVEGVKELYKYTGSTAGRPSIILFNVQGYNIAAQSQGEKLAARILNYHAQPYYEVLRRMGVALVNWDPIEESFANALQRQRGVA